MVGWQCCDTPLTLPNNAPPTVRSCTRINSRRCVYDRLYIDGRLEQHVSHTTADSCMLSVSGFASAFLFCLLLLLLSHPLVVHCLLKAVADVVRVDLSIGPPHPQYGIH